MGSVSSVVVLVRGVRWFAVRGVLVLLTSGAVLADMPGGALRLTCVAEPGVDVVGLDALCWAVGEGMADALGREVAVVEGAAEVSLRVMRLDARRVRARLHWAGREPGPEVDLGSVDAVLTEPSYRMMARGLLAVSPPP